MLFTGSAFLEGKFTPRSAEYFGLILGLSQIAQHPESVRNRRLVLMGDSQPIRRHLHQDLAPSEDSQQLVPLVEVAQEALRPLRDVARSVEVAVVKRSAGAVDVENKMARAALRAGAPTLDVIANAALFDALRKAEAVVVAKTVRAPPAEHVQ